jgi:hypothetical protein
MSTRLRHEVEDLGTLALALFLVPIVWWLLLGWRWPFSLAGHDGLAQNLLRIREIVESGQGWSSLVYRPDLLGGLPGRDTFGPFPLWAALAGLGLSPVGVSIIATFLVQSLLGFLGCRVMMDLAAGWAGVVQASPATTAQAGSASCPARTTLLERAGSVCLCAFAPSLGWRVGFGHLSMMVGLLPLAATLALVSAAATWRTTALLILVAAASLVNGLLFNGVQMVVYGAVFGAPIVLGLWLGLRGKWRNLAIPLLTIVGSILLAMPGFWPMLCHARSSDAPRSLGDAVVTYDFVTATASDWLTSLPWTKAAIPGARAEYLHHEVNYAAGPLLVLLALVPWRKQRALAVGLGLSLIAIVGFSMDLTFVSRTLLALIPPLRSFRVPNRAVLPWLLVLPTLAAAALVQHRRETPQAPAVPPSRPARSRRARATEKPGKPARWPAVAAAVLVALGLFFFPPIVREVVIWCLALALVVLRWRWNRGAPAGAVLLVLAVCGVAAFKERLLPIKDVRPMLSAAARLGEGVRRAKPELESPLARVRMDGQIVEFSVNTAFAAGLSSIDGYETPTRRFLAERFALQKTPYLPTAALFELPTSDAAFPVMRQLYNVGWVLASAPGGSMTLSSLGPTAGPAWFSASLSRLPTLDSLADALLGPGKALRERMGQVMWLVDSDGLTKRAPSEYEADSQCAQARVIQVQASRRGHEVIAEVMTDAACPLTLAMNFTEDLRATAVLADGQRPAVPVFPAYGALTGVIVPSHAQKILVRAEPPRLPMAPAWAALGMAICLGAMALALRRPT